MIKIDDPKLAETFRKWLVDVVYVAGRGDADAQVVKTVQEQARQYSMLLNL
jgi:hypothetical protein